MMKIRELFKDVDYIAQGEFGDLDINKVAADSRLVEEGDLYVAISGIDNDGHDFINEALRRGAKALVLQRGVNVESLGKTDAARGPTSCVINVKDTRETLALLAANFYGNPSKKIKMIGITGTNGKTTVSYLLKGLLETAKFKAGLIGTVGYKIGEESIEAGNTTPPPLTLQALIKKMVECSLDYCVMEASSHGLDQHRTDGIDFNIAVFTNATREHLDYHKGFDNYLSSKERLFETLDRDGIAVLNKDDPSFQRMRDASAAWRVVSYGLKKGADLYADRIDLKADGTSFVMHSMGETIFVRSHLIGLHNIYNMLAAASCAISEGLGLTSVKKGLEGAVRIPGRLELVDAPAPFKIFVDYAHTDDALEKVLNALKGLRERALITVFGCGGDRDREKRPRMGAAAARLSDYVIITSDNPRYEEPDKIADDIAAGINRDFKNFEVILDRRRAIEEAIRRAEEGDIVLIAGKGHERHQIVKEREIPFCDTEAVKSILKAKKECLT